MTSFATIAPYYNSIFPYKTSKGNFIEQYLSVKPARILDLGCATGALAIDLAKRSHFVTGIDLDREMIAIARNDAGNSRTEFELMDMLLIDEEFGSSQFHLVSCLGNTLVQLDSRDKIFSLLSKIRSILKPGGIFISQTVNYDNIVPEKIFSLPTIENDELIFSRNYVFSGSSRLIEFKTQIIDKTKATEISNTALLYPLLSEEFQDLARQSGCKEINLLGDFDGKAFNSKSPALIGILRT